MEHAWLLLDYNENHEPRAGPATIEWFSFACGARRSGLNRVFTEHNRTVRVMRARTSPASGTLGRPGNGRQGTGRERTRRRGVNQGAKWLKAQREITGHRGDIATYRSIREASLVVGITTKRYNCPGDLSRWVVRRREGRRGPERGALDRERCVRSQSGSCVRTSSARGTTRGEERVEEGEKSIIERREYGRSIEARLKNPDTRNAFSQTPDGRTDGRPAERGAGSRGRGIIRRRNRETEAAREPARVRSGKSD